MSDPEDALRGVAPNPEAGETAASEASLEGSTEAGPSVPSPSPNGGAMSDSSLDPHPSGYFPMPARVVDRVPSNAGLVPVRALPPPPDEPEPLPGYTMLGPVHSDRQARDWSLVLQSMGIAFERRRFPVGWVLFVSDDDYAKAAKSIQSFEAENRDWPPRPVKERPRHAPSLAIPVVFALLAAFALITGPAAAGSIWFARGAAISSQVMSSAPFRAVTALTLHADSAHVLGNVISGSVFGAAVSRRLGPGGAALSILATGALGNLANAAYHRLAGVEHASIGASTAVFGAIGLLAATQVVLDRPIARKRGWLEIAAPIVGGFALLGSLGAGGERTDLGAHFFGLLAGVLLGLGVGFPLRRARLSVDMAGGHAGHASHEVEIGVGAKRWWVQPALGAVAASIVIGRWELALRR